MLKREDAYSADGGVLGHNGGGVHGGGSVDGVVRSVGSGREGEDGSEGLHFDCWVGVLDTLVMRRERRNECDRCINRCIKYSECVVVRKERRGTRLGGLAFIYHRDA